MFIKIWVCANNTYKHLYEKRHVGRWGTQLLWLWVQARWEEGFARGLGGGITVWPRVPFTAHVLGEFCDRRRGTTGGACSTHGSRSLRRSSGSGRPALNVVRCLRLWSNPCLAIDASLRLCESSQRRSRKVSSFANACAVNSSTVSGSAMEPTVGFLTVSRAVVDMIFTTVSASATPSL